MWERNKRVWSGGGGGEEQDSYGISITFCQEYKHMCMTQVSFNYYNVSWEEGGRGGILWPTCDDTYRIIIALVRPNNYKFIYCCKCLWAFKSQKNNLINFFK